MKDTIKIQDKNFHVNLGMGVFIELAEKWNCEGMDEMNEVFLSFSQITDNVPIKLLRKVNDLIIAVINNGDNSEQISEKLLLKLPPSEYMEVVNVAMSLLSKSIVTEATQDETMQLNDEEKKTQVAAN